MSDTASKGLTSVQQEAMRARFGLEGTAAIRTSDIFMALLVAEARLAYQTGRADKMWAVQCGAHLERRVDNAQRAVNEAQKNRRENEMVIEEAERRIAKAQEDLKALDVKADP